VRQNTSGQYYEEVRIIPEDGRSGSGAFRAIGAVICGILDVNFREHLKGEVQLRRIHLPRTPVNKDLHGSSTDLLACGVQAGYEGNNQKNGPHDDRSVHQGQVRLRVHPDVQDEPPPIAGKP
jgi:hypothetical protein